MSIFHCVKVDENGNVVAAMTLPFSYLPDESWHEVPAPVQPGEAVVSFDNGTISVNPIGERPSDFHIWDSASGQWVLDTERKAADQSNRITIIRDRIRDSPIQLDDGWVVDADRDSVIIMDETVVNWDHITYMRTEAGEQMWKGTDNSIRSFDRQAFEAMVAEVHRKRAIRLDIAFAYAESIRALLPVPDDHPVFDRANWPGQ